MSTRSLATFNAGGLRTKLKLNSKMSKREIIEWLREAQQQRAYTTLTFDEVTLDPEITAEVLDLFRISSRHGRVWERLNLEFCDGQLDLVVTGALMMDCVKHLFLASDKVQETIMKNLATTLRVTTGLRSLWMLLPMSEESASYLGEGLKYNHSIDKLSLSGCNWDPEDDDDDEEEEDDETTKDKNDEYTPEADKGGDEKGEDDNGVPKSYTAAPIALASGLLQNEGIRHLDLSCCYMQDQAIAPIVEALIDHPFLEILDVSRNLCRTKSLEAIATLVKSPVSRLKTLDLREQSRRKPLEISIISHALRNNDSLKTLKLSHNQLTDSQVVELVSMLRGNDRIKELDLQFNQISEKGVKILTKRIKELPTLSALLLGGNDFGEEGFNLLESLPDDDDSICTVTEEDMKKAKTAKRGSSNYFGFLSGINEST